MRMVAYSLSHYRHRGFQENWEGGRAISARLPKAGTATHRDEEHQRLCTITRVSPAWSQGSSHLPAGEIRVLPEAERAD
jgi:hypothetical protein